MSATQIKLQAHPGILNEPWYREDMPYNFTATGYLGIKRQGMLTNQLLRRDRLSHGRSTTSDTVFGNIYRSPWTVAHALTGWTVVTGDTSKRPGRKPKTKGPVDYMNLNRGAVGAAMLTSSDFNTFRKVKVPLDKKVSSINGKIERGISKSYKPETVYGAPVEHKSTIEDLTSNWYQRKYLQESLEGVVEKPKKIKVTNFRQNRASMLRPKLIPIGVDVQPWRSPNIIGKAKPQLSTFRSETALQNAWKVP